MAAKDLRDYKADEVASYPVEFDPPRQLSVQHDGFLPQAALFVSFVRLAVNSSTS